MFLKYAHTVKDMPLENIIQLETPNLVTQTNKTLSIILIFPAAYEFDSKI